MTTPAESAAGQGAVAELARSGVDHFRRQGIELEIVRSRPNCLVVRSRFPSPALAARGRSTVSDWLGSLPRTAHRVPGTVLESVSAPGDGRRFVHTLLWNQAPDAAEPLAMSGPQSPPPAPLPPAPSLPPHLAGFSSPPGAPQQPGPMAGSSAAWGPPRPSPMATPAGAAPARPAAGRTPGPPVSGRYDGTSPPAAVPAGLVPVPPPAVVPSAPRAIAPSAPRAIAPSAPWASVTAAAAAAGAPGGRGQEIGGNRAATAGPTGAPGGSLPLAGTATRVPGSARGPAAAVPAGRSRGRRWAWVRRRGWMVALGVVAGALGGQLAGGHGATGYGSTAELVVQSGASTTGPGANNQAQYLAITYAALIPDDQDLVRRAAAELGTTPAAVQGHLSVQAEAGTSLLEVRYTGTTSAQAEAGSAEVARLLSSTSPPGQAIAAGTIAEVSPPTAATRSGSLHKYGLPLGVVLGLLIGCGAALVAERADRRVDDLGALGDGVGCPATVVPGGLSTAELAVALEREVDAPVTVLPLRPAQVAAAEELARALSAAWPVGAEHPPVETGPAFASAPASLGEGDGATVMVVGAGERLALVHEMAERLRLVGRDPAWAVLDAGTVAGGRRGHGS